MSATNQEPHEPGNGQLLDHCYDGIQEFDNPMPRWWLWGLYASIAFSVIYVFDPTRSVKGPGRDAEYAAEQAAFLKAHPPTAVADAALLVAAASDKARGARGAAVFAQNCAACHRADGGGMIGPNLTDEYWLHGNSLPEVYKTIDEGVLAKGMPAWGKLLKPEQVLDVLAYVHGMQEHEAKDGKAPQGVKVEEQEHGSASGEEHKGA